MDAKTTKAIIQNKTLYKPFYSKDVTPYNKKYSVYVNKDGKPKLIHFGSYGYGHFKDKLEKYKAYDHGDPIRRANYRKRHKKAGDVNNKNTAAYWAYNILW